MKPTREARKMGDLQICEAHGCADEVENVNIEAFELTGKVLCESCAEEAFEKDAQQGGAG